METLRFTISGKLATRVDEVRGSQTRENFVKDCIEYVVHQLLDEAQSFCEN
jgi:hypothetical protein